MRRREICEENDNDEIVPNDKGDIIKETESFSLSQYKDLLQDDEEEESETDTIEDINDILGDSY